MKQKIVLHFLDGTLLKGTTSDFSEEKGSFHITKRKTEERIKVNLSDLKGIFFVKNFDGNPAHSEQYEMSLPALGKKVVVTFKDGEEVRGNATELLPERKGFFLYICNWKSNNEKIFVLHAATKQIDQESDRVDLRSVAIPAELIEK